MNKMENIPFNCLVSKPLMDITIFTLGMRKTRLWRLSFEPIRTGKQRQQNELVTYSSFFPSALLIFTPLSEDQGRRRECREAQVGQEAFALK